jgi:uncharacterized protein (TIGR03437 family)
MTSFRKMLSVAVAAAAISCVAAPENLLATAPNVTYTATGTFSTTLVSGNDLFQLRGEPFSINVVANAATVPTAHGTHWAKYTKLKMQGTVTSALLPTPISISDGDTSLELATGNPNYDVFVMFSPVTVVGVQVQILATIYMPSGTIANALIHPFTAPVTLNPGDATVSYSDGSNITVLTVANGTLNATIPGSATTTLAPALHAAGARVITGHSDGTQSVRATSSAPVDLSNSTDKVVLQFYASGVRNASDVHVQIAGQEVPVLYAGPAGNFKGLDQVSVQVPSSLAGMGDAAVVMTVDGQTAAPVHVHIQ